MTNSVYNSIKYTLPILVVFGLILASSGAVLAAIDPATGQYRLNAPSTTTTTGTTSAGSNTDAQRAQIFNPLGAIWANLFNSSKTITSDPVITVVSVPGQKDIYRIISGKKHLLITGEIFYSYGYSSEIIQPITAQELTKYPRARHFRVMGDETGQIYYLTEGGFIRPMISNEAFLSYGDRFEDIIFINQKEFNYYPRSQFVYVERPDLDKADIYQISGGVKRYVTPLAVKRMKIREGDVAPINIFEFDAYPTGSPVLF